MTKMHNYFRTAVLIAFLCPVILSGADDVDKITRDKLNEKLEFYKVSYPKFKYQEARKAAEKKYPMEKKGEIITLNSRLQKVTGKYKGFENGRIYIGSKVILQKDVSESLWYKFNKTVCEEVRRKYVETLFSQYSKKRSRDFEDYRDKLERKYTVVARAEDNSQAAQSTKTVVVETSNTKSIPLAGIIKNDVLGASGRVKAGDLVYDIKQVGYNRYRAKTRDGKRLYTDSRNLFIFLDVKDPSDPFAVTQAALGLMLEKKYKEAVYYARLATALDANQKRSELIESVVKMLVGSWRELGKANAKVTRTEREMAQKARELERNHNAMKDKFAVQAGLRDKTDTLTARITILREQRKKIQTEIKKSLFAVQNYCRNKVTQSAAAGDFIAACLGCNIMVSHISQLRDKAKVTWDDEEKQQYKQYIEKLHLSVVSAYCEAISRPFKDRWFVFLDRYVKYFGYNESELEKFDLKPNWHNLLNGAKASIRESLDFSSAAYTRNFNQMFDNGMKILVVMPHARIVEKLRNMIDKGFSSIDKAVAAANKLYKARLYGKMQDVTAELKPLPLALKENIAVANKETAKSNALLAKAKKAVADKNFNLACEKLSETMKIWPGNPDALKYYHEFYSRHKGVLQDAEKVEKYIRAGRFRDASDICDIMFKERLGYRVYVNKLRQKLMVTMTKISVAMETAENYYKAGRYEDALKIYAEYKFKPGMTRVYQVMLDRAQSTGNIKEQIRLLELLERWEESGNLRRELQEKEGK